MYVLNILNINLGSHQLRESRVELIFIYCFPLAPKILDAADKFWSLKKEQ